MKPAVEVSITSWKKNVVKPGQEYGRVLLMPGTGYNCDRPLLYWSARLLVEAGWRIGPHERTRTLPTTCPR